MSLIGHIQLLLKLVGSGTGGGGGGEDPGGDDGAGGLYIKARPGGDLILTSGGEAIRIRTLAADGEVNHEGTDPIITIAGKFLIVVKDLVDGVLKSKIYKSTDGGQTYTLLVNDFSGIAVYEDMATYTTWIAAIGDQYLNVKLDRFETLSGGGNYAGQIVGDIDADVTPPVEQHNPSATEGDWRTLGFPRLFSEDALDTAALASDGTNYWIIGRTGSPEFQPADEWHLFKATDTVKFVDQGRPEQDPADPNAFASPDVPGAFHAYWVLGRATSPRLGHELRKIGTRWFLNIRKAVYYTDDLTLMTGWKRCPMGISEGTSHLVKILNLLDMGTHLVAVNAGYASGGASRIAVSSDNGATWTAYAPSALDGSNNLFAVAKAGGVACIYDKRYSEGDGRDMNFVLTATAPFSTWSYSTIASFPENVFINKIRNTSAGVFAEAKTVGVTPGGNINGSPAFSADGVAFNLVPI